MSLQSNLKKSLIATMLAVIASPSFADSPQSITGVGQSLNQAQSMKNTVENQINLQDLNQNRLREDKWTEWGLTQEEWTRYEKVMKGKIGVWSPNIDPLTALGLDAKNDAERQHFAEILARIEYERAEKLIAFQLAYDQAFKKLYPGQLPFKDTSGDNNKHTQNFNRIAYFTRVDCGEKCEKNLTRLFNVVGNNPVDIYIVGSQGKDEVIQKWALQNKIDIEKVKSRQITLNHDKGYWLAYADGKIPAAFRMVGQEWQPLTY